MAIEQLDLDLLGEVEVDEHRAAVGWDDIISWYWRCIPCGHRGAGYDSRAEAEKWMLRHTSPAPIPPIPKGPDPLAPDPTAPAPYHGHETGQMGKKGYRLKAHKHQHWWTDHSHTDLRPFEDWSYVHPDDIPSEQPDACLYGDGRTKHIRDEKAYPWHTVGPPGTALCGFKGRYRVRGRPADIPICRRCQQVLQRIEEVGHA